MTDYELFKAFLQQTGVPFEEVPAELTRDGRLEFGDYDDEKPRLDDADGAVVITLSPRDFGRHPKLIGDDYAFMRVLFHRDGSMIRMGIWE